MKKKKTEKQIGRKKCVWCGEERHERWEEGAKERHERQYMYMYLLGGLLQFLQRKAEIYSSLSQRDICIDGIHR